MSFEEYRKTLPMHRLMISANCCRDAYDYQQSKIDELQKRIDEALNHANDAHSDLNIGMLAMVSILKGEK